MIWNKITRNDQQDDSFFSVLWKFSSVFALLRNETKKFRCINRDEFLCFFFWEEKIVISNIRLVSAFFSSSSLSQCCLFIILNSYHCRMMLSVVGVDLWISKVTENCLQNLLWVILFLSLFSYRHHQFFLIID